MRRVAEEVGLDQDLGDDGGFVGIESGAGQECGGVGDEGGCGVARGHAANVGAKEKTLQLFSGRVCGEPRAVDPAAPAGRSITAKRTR